MPVEQPAGAAFREWVIINGEIPEVRAEELLDLWRRHGGSAGSPIAPREFWKRADKILGICASGWGPPPQDLRTLISEMAGINSGRKPGRKTKTSGGFQRALRLDAAHRLKHGVPMPDLQLSRRAGVGRSTIYDWRSKGLLPE